MAKRREQRVTMPISVRIRGLDAEGKVFTQNARTVNITPGGARLYGVSARLEPGFTVGNSGTDGRFSIKTKGNVGWFRFHRVTFRLSRFSKPWEHRQTGGDGSNPDSRQYMSYTGAEFQRTAIMLTTLLFFAGFMYLVAPLIVLATQRQAANPQFQPYGNALQDPKFTFLTESAARIQNLGFDLIGYFGLVGQTSNTTIFLAYLVHRKNGDSAVAVIVLTNAGISTQLVEFSTRFVDQSSLTTGNSKVLGVYLRPRQKPVYHFPWVKDPSRLYQLHQQLIQRDKSGMQKDYVKPGGEVERLCQGMQREMADQLGPGILRLNKTGEWYRPTLKGAYLMCWKMLPPCKQIRAALRNSNRRRIENALLGSVVSPAPISPS